MYLLDTNIISELRLIPKNKANIHVEQWAKSCKSHQFFVSTISLMELEKGCLLKKRKDTQQGDMLLKWFYHTVIPSFENCILVIDTLVASVCASLHIPNPRPENDTWIAATAIVHDLILVTRNVKDYAGLPVKILNPFNE